MRTAENLARKCRNMISGDSVDATELRQSAVDALMASRKQRTRSKLISAGRALALELLDHVDNDADQANLAKASQQYEHLRI